MIRSHVLICGGTGCTSSGSMVLISSFEEELKKNGLEDEIKITVIATGFDANNKKDAADADEAEAAPAEEKSGEGAKGDDFDLFIKMLNGNN